MSTPLTPGQVINVTGTVDTLPSLRQANRQWGLNSADMRGQVYVGATGVEIRSPQ
ncbi:MAG: hypothetical protein M1541_02615 [Acidobacteria bacterium]|nr:hypothetical protein [Acidobacteriota bacterium]